MIVYTERIYSKGSDTSKNGRSTRVYGKNTRDYMQDSIDKRIDSRSKPRTRHTQPSASFSLAFESTFAKCMASYCKNYAKEYDGDNSFKSYANMSKMKSPGMTDLDRTTSFRVNNNEAAHKAGILRLELTPNFSSTVDMPAIYKGTVLMNMPNNNNNNNDNKMALKFGIRTASKAEGFAYPIVVAGVDDVNNTNNLTKEQLSNMLSRSMPTIMYVAGNILAAYNYKTEPDYVAYVDAKNIPYCSIKEIREMSANFVPNYKGAPNISTRETSDTYMTSLNLANTLSKEQNPDNPSRFANQLNKQNPSVGNLPPTDNGDPNRWVERLMRENEELAKSDAEQADIEPHV